VIRETGGDVEITEVRISPAKGGKVRAFVSIIIDDCFIVNDLRVMEGREGQLFVTMPARKTRNGQMRDTAHPLNSETRQVIEDRVLTEFRLAVDNLAVSSQKPSGAKVSTLDRIASRLFSEEFWVPEESREN